MRDLRLELLNLVGPFSQVLEHHFVANAAAHSTYTNILVYIYKYKFIYNVYIYIYIVLQ